MKHMILAAALSAMVSTSSFASDIQAVCTARQGRMDTKLIDAKTLQIRLDAKTIVFKKDRSRERAMSGTYYGDKFNGADGSVSFLYESKDLRAATGLPENAYAMVERHLMNGKDGVLTLAIRKEYPEGGAAWSMQRFNCRVD